MQLKCLLNLQATSNQAQEIQLIRGTSNANMKITMNGRKYLTYFPTYIMLLDTYVSTFHRFRNKKNLQQKHLFTNHRSLHSRGTKLEKMDSEYTTTLRLLFDLTTISVTYTKSFVSARLLFFNIALRFGFSTRKVGR